MFDASQILELLKAEPGHGLLQSILLFMIWNSSRGLKREVIKLKDSLMDMKISHEIRLTKIEGRISALELVREGK